MATGSFMMGTLKGKLGETVAMRRNGKQVVRAYISNPKNPNSQKQQVQRMVQATAAQAYSAMKKICDHSFEGVQVGQKSMSYFMSKNMDYLRASIAANSDGTLVNASADFVRKGVNLPVLNKYVVGKGTLPNVELYDVENPTFADFSPYTNLLLYKSSDIDLAESVNIFVTNNNGQIGDWFTFLFLFRVNGATQGGQDVYRFDFFRCLVGKTESGDVTKFSLVPSLTSSGVVDLEMTDVFNVISPTGTGSFGLSLLVNGVFNNVGKEDGKLTPCAYAVIHSRQNVGGSWQRSNAEFVIRDNWKELGITYPSDFESALASYSGAGEAKGTGDYVLNGGV